MGKAAGGSCEEARGAESSSSSSLKEPAQQVMSWLGLLRRGERGVRRLARGSVGALSLSIDRERRRSCLRRLSRGRCGSWSRRSRRRGGWHHCRRLIGRRRSGRLGRCGRGAVAGCGGWRRGRRCALRWRRSGRNLGEARVECRCRRVIGGSVRRGCGLGWGGVTSVCAGGILRLFERGAGMMSVSCRGWVAAPGSMAAGERSVFCWGSAESTSGWNEVRRAPSVGLVGLVTRSSDSVAAFVASSAGGLA